MAVASSSRPAGDATLGPPEPVALRLRDGSREDRRLGADAHAVLLSELLHSAGPGFVEVVGARRGTDGRLGRFDRFRRENFVAAGDREALLSRVRSQREGVRREVFLTPATLSVAAAGNESVRSSAVAWVDIDDPRRLEDLRGFGHSPHAVIYSGSGGAHAYWLLAEPLAGDRCDALNRKLAAALGADLASANRGRIMRVPGTLNWKRSRRGRDAAWCRVAMCDLAKAAYDPAVLATGLRDPKAQPPARRRAPRAVSAAEEPWREMEAADYYRAITGAEPRRDGKVRCPHAAHEDHHPSAQLYGGAGAGWYCFACGHGGGAVDMLAALRGWPTGAALRREQFSSCVAELRRIFGVSGPGPRSSGRR